jgi:hypothetical protein
MAIVEAGDDFGIDDHKIINDEIGNEEPMCWPS